MIRYILKLFRSSRSTLVLFLLTLCSLIVSLAFMDYLQVRSISYSLAVEKSRVLINHVEQSTKRASIAEDYMREAMADHLFAVASLFRQRLNADSVAFQDWSTLILDGGVSRVDLYDKKLRWINGSHPTFGEGTQFPISRLHQEQDGWVIGLFYDAISKKSFYGVVLRLFDGGLIRVALNSEHLLDIRRNVGMSALLLDLTENPEVLYAILDTKEQLIASTPDLPDWVEQPGHPLHERALATTSFEAEFLDSPSGPVFEARTPFGENTGVILRLGIVSPGLQQIRDRALWSIALRTFFVLTLTLIFFAYFISRQNILLLKQEKERILREVQSLEADKTLRERLVAMGSLAGGVAHEIRNPLNTIGIAAQRIEYQLNSDQRDTQFKAIIVSIRSEAQRIERIVSDFLSFARPPVTNKQQNQINQVLEPVVNTFTSLALAKQVQFDVEMEEHSPGAFDADQLRQSVLNLLRNSLESMGKSGNRITLRSGSENGRVWVSVMDNGKGVKAEDKRKIFDLYYSTRAEGTGLGLPQVHRFAVNHGGKVDLKDTDGGGATFTIIWNENDE
jgi:signal transduction histidine kinase